MAWPVIAAAVSAAIKSMQENKAQNEQNGQNGNAKGGLGNVFSVILDNTGKGSDDTSSDDTSSDERLKEMRKEGGVADAMAKIDAYLYRYRPEAREMYGGSHGIDGKEHVGVMAQELAENPLTADAVETDENGYLMVDTGRLCLTLAAVCSDLSKRVLALEGKGGAEEGGKENGGE